MALRRMMARRGKPKRIFSDYGTNLRGASEELRKSVKSLNKDEILRQTCGEKNRVALHPARKPTHGRLLGKTDRFRQTCTRSDTKRKGSDDPSDTRSLTPNDFLWLMPGIVRGAHSAPGVFTDADALRRQWRYSQWLADHFWRRCIKEYLPSINRRAQWHRERRDFQVDDLVVIWDEAAPRNQWRRGRVVAVYPWRDGRFRVADVKTATGVFCRAAAKLCVLEMP